MPAAGSTKYKNETDYALLEKRIYVAFVYMTVRTQSGVAMCRMKFNI